MILLKVLYKYARKIKRIPYVWHFFTGKDKSLKILLIDGFKVPMGEKEPVEGVVGVKKLTFDGYRSHGKICS